MEYGKYIAVLNKHCAMNIFRAETEIIPVACESVWRGAVELTTEGTIGLLLAGKVWQFC